MQIPQLNFLFRVGFSHQTTWCSLFAVSVTYLCADWSVAQSRQQGSRSTQSPASQVKVTKGAEGSKKERKKDEKAPQKVMIGGVEWYVDYNAALKIAQEENKPMWLHFGENPG